MKERGKAMVLLPGAPMRRGLRDSDQGHDAAVARAATNTGRCPQVLGGIRAPPRFFRKPAGLARTPKGCERTHATH